MIRRAPALLAAAVAAWLLGHAHAAQQGADIEALKAQLDGLEFDLVAERAEAVIADVEQRQGRYHVDLVEPLTLLGDAQLGAGDADAALDSYDRARHIVRIDDGVLGLGQVDLLYREALALTELGDMPTANERHEFAYSLKARAYGEDSPELLPGLNQLIGWYLHHYKFRPAQLLYERVLEIVRENYPSDHPLLVSALRGYVDTFRQWRFGLRQSGRGGFSAWPPGFNRDPPWFQRRSYRNGKKTLREVLDITEAQPAANDADIARAALDLGDWHLLYGESGIAMRYYRRVWKLLDSNRTARDALFGTPKPLYVPSPDRKTRSAGPDSEPDGVVELALTITHRGDVVGRKTLRAEPHDIMEFKVRKAAKNAVYRPAFDGANPVRWKGLRLEYRYEYVRNALARR